MFNKKQFGQRLSSLRNSRSLSQQAIADILGVGKSAVSMMESGNRAASADVLIALADYFDVSIDYLVGRSASPVILDRIGEVPDDEADNMPDR